MLAYKIRLNGNDQEQRFSSKEEAQMLVDVFADDYPKATIEIIKIYQSTGYISGDIEIDAKVFEAEQ